MAWSAAMDSAKEHLPALVYSEPTSKSKDPCKGSKKRPYRCIGQDGISDDDLTDKKRRLTVEQVNFLEMSFSADLKLEPERKALIAKQLGLRPRQVAIWFQNRRARWKNKQVEQDYETLKASYDAVIKEKESLTKEYESAVESNMRLQAEVVRLTNLLQGVNNTYMTTKPTAKEDRHCNSELMSPTKSADCESEIEDLSMPTDQKEVAMSNPPSQVPSSTIACAVMAEGDCIPFLSSDNVFSSLPLLVQELIANGHCIEDAYNIYMGCEYFGGGWR